MNKKQVVWGAVLVIAIVAGWWFMKGRNREPVRTEETASSAEAGMGAEVFGQVSQNPAEKMPETNPFVADTNPYSGAYKNPFGQ
jgi:hypothetical protein